MKSVYVIKVSEYVEKYGHLNFACTTMIIRLRHNENVILDFAGITSISSNFLSEITNGIDEFFSYDYIKEKVEIHHSNAGINRMIREQFDRVYNGK